MKSAIFVSIAISGEYSGITAHMRENYSIYHYREKWNVKKWNIISGEKVRLSMDYSVYL